MKLSEYIVKEYNKSHSALSEEDVERWIVDWYNDTFKELDNEDKPRGPPMWLADWRMFKIRDIIEQERCGIDEG
jgi:hypothetical protein